LHHHSSSDGVKGIRGESRDGGNDLSEEELEDDGGVSFVFEKECLSGVVSSEVASSVCNDTQN